MKMDMDGSDARQTTIYEFEREDRWVIQAKFQGTVERDKEIAGMTFNVLYKT